MVRNKGKKLVKAGILEQQQAEEAHIAMYAGGWVTGRIRLY